MSTKSATSAAKRNERKQKCTFEFENLAITVTRFWEYKIMLTFGSFHLQACQIVARDVRECKIFYTEKGLGSEDTFGNPR